MIIAHFQRGQGVPNDLFVDLVLVSTLEVGCAEAVAKLVLYQYALLINSLRCVGRTKGISFPSLSFTVGIGSYWSALILPLFPVPQCQLEEKDRKMGAVTPSW